MKSMVGFCYFDAKMETPLQTQEDDGSESDAQEQAMTAAIDSVLHQASASPEDQATPVKGCEDESLEGRARAEVDVAAVLDAMVESVGRSAVGAALDLPGTLIAGADCARRDVIDGK